MSCACENRRMGSDKERIRGLAKAWAKNEGKTVAMYKNADGTYGFMSAELVIDKHIEEYITPY